MTVTEVRHPAGSFLDDSSYDRIDPATGKTDRVNRQAGDVIWRNKCEHALRLINRARRCIGL